MEELPEAIGEGEIVAVPEMYPNTDMSDPYTVNMYLIGDKPNDWDSVLEKVNTYLEPFNTDLAVTFMSWSDYQTMYSLVLAGGEQVDLIFTAPWCYMYTEAAKGSFYELTDEFIADYMPLSKRYQAEESWEETTIAGQTVAVPSDVAAPMGKIAGIVRIWQISTESGSWIPGRITKTLCLRLRKRKRRKVVSMHWQLLGIIMSCGMCIGSRQIRFLP